MKTFPLIVGAILLIFAGLVSANAQNASDPTATIQLSNGQTLAIDDFSDQIGVQPNEPVTVTISFPTTSAGETIQIASLDGGIVNGPEVIAGDGTLKFRFQAPANCGQIRIVIRYGLKTVRLLCWVLSSNPENNPPVVAPANQ